MTNKNVYRRAEAIKGALSLVIDDLDALDMADATEVVEEILLRRLRVQIENAETCGLIRVHSL